MKDMAEMAKEQLERMRDIDSKYKKGSPEHTKAMDEVSKDLNEYRAKLMQVINGEKK